MSSAAPQALGADGAPVSARGARARSGSVNGTSRGLQPKEDPKQLLASLTENSQFGPAIKAVFDRSWQSEFKSFLDASIEKKDKEIRHTCNSHYEEFIGSVDSLLSVNKDMADLRALVTTLNNKVKESGAKIVDKAEKLSAARTIRQNLSATIHVLEACLQVFELAAKAIEQIETKRYFSALKSIQRLQVEYLPRFSELDFCRQLEEQLPMMTLQVRERVKTEFSVWLQSSRARAKSLGALAMTQTDVGLKQLEKKGTHSSSVCCCRGSLRSPLPLGVLSSALTRLALLSESLLSLSPETQRHGGGSSVFST